MSGTFRVTQRNVAEAAGVSVATVSLALRGDPQLPEATRERIRSLARAMGYVPNPVLAAGMAQVRHRKEATSGGTLYALHTQPLAELTRWAAIRDMVAGAQARAGKHGYRLELQHLESAGINGMLRRIRNRGIPGAIVIGPRWPEIDDVLTRIVELIPAVRASGSMEGVALNFSQADFFRGVMLAFDRVLATGGRRIGLVVDPAFDEAAGNMISGAYFSRVHRLPRRDQLNALQEANPFSGALQAWWARERPDTILTTQKELTRAEWQALNPTDQPVRLVQIGWTEETPDWEGIHFPQDQMGAAAVDMVVAQIHLGERGLPPHQTGMLIEGSWQG